MPDEVRDVKDAGSTGAPEPSTGTTLTPPADTEAYSEWRLTGKLPEQKQKPEKSKTEESAPSTSAEGEAEAGEQSAKPEEEAPEEEIAPAPEAGKRKQERRKSDAAIRLEEIIADLKRAGLSPSELKTFRRQAQQVQAQPAPSQTSVNPPAQAQPLKEPKLEDFKTWEEFRAAERAYNDQRTDERVREVWQQMQAQQAQQQASQQAAQRLTEARERYGEDAESSIVNAAQTLFGDSSIHPSIKGIVNDSPVIADLLYVMGSNQADFDQFLQTARSNPGEAIRRAVLLEQLVKDELKKQQNGSSTANRQEPERDESGRFTPARKEAPPPAREVSGRASPPPNAAEAAFHRGDERAYFALKNAEQIAARKGR